MEFNSIERKKTFNTLTKFIKDEQKTIEELLKELSAKTGENIRVKQFARFEIGG